MKCDNFTTRYNTNTTNNELHWSRYRIGIWARVVADLFGLTPVAMSIIDGVCLLSTNELIRCWLRPYSMGQ